LNFDGEENVELRVASPLLEIVMPGIGQCDARQGCVGIMVVMLAGRSCSGGGWWRWRCNMTGLFLLTHGIERKAEGFIA